jgi:hypothetical protein
MKKTWRLQMCDIVSRFQLRVLIILIMYTKLIELGKQSG